MKKKVLCILACSQQILLMGSFAANSGEAQSHDFIPSDKFDGAPIIALEERAGSHPGRFQRVKVVQADFKYPLIRMEESVEDTLSGRNVTRDKIMVADHVVVRLQPGVDARQFARRCGMKIRKKLILPNVYLFTVPATLKGVPEAIEKLKVQPEVVFAHEDSIIQSTGIPGNSPFFQKQWALHNDNDKDIDAPEAWDWTTGSNSITVAVLDSGILKSHPDLALNIGANPGEIAGNGMDDDGNGFVDDKWGWDFVNNDADPTDDNGHGTSVAGIIGARGNNGEGVEGVCWLVKMISIKVSDKDGAGTDSTMSEGVWYAASLGVDVMNMSWGLYQYSDELKLALQEASNKNMVMVCGVGNDGANTDLDPFYPACYNVPNIISVAATDKDDTLVDIANWWASNYGIASVDLTAPGSYCYTTTLPSLDFPYKPYGNFHGTSCATPHVAGVCALVKSLNPSLSAAQIKTIILQSVDKIPSLAGKVATGGRLNAFRAVKLAMGNPLAPLHAEPDSYIVPFNKVLKVKSGAQIMDKFSLTTGPTILANDTLAVGAANIVSLQSNPNQGGTATVNTDGSTLEYYSKQNFIGTETLEYLLTAGNESSVGKVNVTMLPPSVEDDEYQSSDNVIVVDSGAGVLENDGFSLMSKMNLVIKKQPENGDLIPDMSNGCWTGRFTYTRTKNIAANAVDTFVYEVSFPNTGIQPITATVTLTTNYIPKFNIVWEEWIPPIKKRIPSYVVSSYDNNPVKIDVEFSAAGRGNVAIKRKPNKGTLMLSRDGQLEYVPRGGIAHMDKFQVVVSEAGVTRTIEVTIQSQTIK